MKRNSKRPALERSGFIKQIARRWNRESEDKTISYLRGAHRVANCDYEKLELRFLASLLQHRKQLNESETT